MTWEVYKIVGSKKNRPIYQTFGMFPTPSAAAEEAQRIGALVRQVYSDEELYEIREIALATGIGLRGQAKRDHRRAQRLRVKAAGQIGPRRAPPRAITLIVCAAALSAAWIVVGRYRSDSVFAGHPYRVNIFTGRPEVWWRGRWMSPSNSAFQADLPSNRMTPAEKRAQTDAIIRDLDASFRGLGFKRDAAGHWR